MNYPTATEMAASQGSLEKPWVTLADDTKELGFSSNLGGGEIV